MPLQPRNRKHTYSPRLLQLFPASSPAVNPFMPPPGHFLGFYPGLSTALSEDPPTSQQ